MANNRTSLMLIPTGMQPIPRNQPAWLNRVQPSQSDNPNPRIRLVDVLLNDSVAGATGAILGFIDSELKDGLDYHGVAVDGVSAAALGMAAYAFNSPAALAGSQVSFGIWTFRQTKKLLGAFRKPATTVAGEPVEEKPSVDSDRIVALGKEIDSEINHGD